MIAPGNGQAGPWLDVITRRSATRRTDVSPGKRPERLVASDPLGRFHKVHHFAGNPDGTYEADSAEYWREVMRCPRATHVT
jgi:hypothetical protein